MPTIIIGSYEYDVYADIATADDYLEADNDSDTYRSLETTPKGRLSVTATRIFERLKWKGDKTDEYQPLAWPRSDTGVDGVDDGITPDIIINANCELMTQLANGVDVANQQNGSQKEKMIKAGSVAVEYFRGADGKPLRLPLPVWEMIRDYLEGSGALTQGSVSYGTDSCDTLSLGYGFNEGI